MKTRIAEESRLRVLAATTEQELQPFTTLADVDVSTASALLAHRPPTAGPPPNAKRPPLNAGPQSQNPSEIVLCSAEHHVIMVLPPVRCQDSTAAHTQNYHYIDKEANFFPVCGIKGVSEWFVNIL
jgi:hypothetical protein